jgi:hypothetical protein
MRLISLEGSSDLSMRNALIRPEPTVSSSETSTVYLHWRVDRQTELDRLSGVLSFDFDAVRTGLPLTASRQRRTRKTAEASNA